MNMFNKLPRFVYINNEKYFIETDFRIFIDFEIEMQGKDKKMACYNALKRFYPAFSKIAENNLINEAVNEFIWFYKCGKKDVEIKTKSSKNMRLYDYEYDSDLIWGAFKTQYNIELDKVNLHWWKFKAMWVSLSKNSQFSIIRGYRSYTGKDKDLLELKEKYKLPPTQFETDEQKRHQEIFKQLNRISQN